MYGQKTTLSVASSGVVAASWWLLGITIVLALVAIILLARVFFALHSRNASRRP